jgi:hypothetical protein
MLISVESKFATYHHVVVVWREMVIDYESMYTYPLTEDTLRQICGVNTTFQQISCGYGILPSTICKAFEAEYSGLGHSRLVQTRKFYKGLFLLEVTR